MDPALRMAIRESVFQQSVAPYLMLDTDLRIVAANRAYLQATARTAGTLVGLDMFDAFPDNPEDPEADGVANLRSSLEKVLRRGRPHNMVLQRYDIQTPAGEGPFRERTWAPVNSPIIDDYGRVAGLLHHVEDLTGLVPGRSAMLSPALWHGLAAGSARLRQTAAGATRANDRLRDALIAVVASPGGDGYGDDFERRRQLWRQVTEQTGDGVWRGWGHALCTVAARVVGAEGGVAITAAAGRTVLAADRSSAAELDELQYTAGEGPTYVAMSLATPVLVADTTADSHRWAGFAAASAGRAPGGVWAYPIGVRGAVLGALTFYFGGEPPQEAAADAAILAELAGAALTIDADELSWESSSDRATLERSHTLNVASGMVAAQLGIDVETARDRIRAAALARAVPLYELAGRILDGQLRLE